MSILLRLARLPSTRMMRMQKSQMKSWNTLSQPKSKIWSGTLARILLLALASLRSLGRAIFWRVCLGGHTLRLRPRIRHLCISQRRRGFRRARNIWNTISGFLKKLGRRNGILGILRWRKGNMPRLRGRARVTKRFLQKSSSERITTIARD